MKSRIDHDNALTKRLVSWKKDQAIVSLTLEEMGEKLGDRTAIYEQKVDGQSTIMDYKKGGAQFATLDGRLIEDIPVLDEIESILKRNKISQAQMVGELAAMEGRRIIGFNESMSIIRNPQADKGKISWHPYQVLNLNGEDISDDYDPYKKAWKTIRRLFGGAKHVRPVEYAEGGKAALKSSWNKLVEKQGNEGLVIRTPDGKVYKCKPEFHYDLVVIAVGDKKGKNWPKRMIGTTLMAFMDKNGVFRTAGEVGTGWSQAERRELFSWAQKDKVDEDDRYVWVKPKKIMEVKWERTTIKEMRSYSYSRGKYERKEKMMSGTIVKPRFIRWRKDKSVTPSDLRLTQIPGWNKREKMAVKVASRFLSADQWDKYRKELGADRVDDFLACLGLGPKYVPSEPTRHTCPQCHGANATYHEEHADTDMNEMVLSCPDCGFNKTASI